MANKLEVTLSFKPLMDGLQRFASAIESRLERVRAFSLQLEQGAQSANVMMTQIAAAIGGAKIAQTFAGIIKSGVGFNEQLEQAELGIAAVLKQFDSAGKFKTFDDALRASASAIELLKQKAKESPASFSDLVQAFQGTAGAMASAGIPLQKQVDLVVTMSQTLAGLGIRSDQILQETRALITGNINADAQAAKILQITAADIAQAKQKGQLYEFLAGKVASFGEAARRGAGSLATLRSNFGDALEQGAAKAMERLNEALKGMYRNLTDLVESPAFKTLLNIVGDKVAVVVDGIAKLANAMQDLGPAAYVFLNLASSAGTLVIALGAVMAPFLALRGLLAALPGLLRPASIAFTFLAGLNFRAAFADLVKLTGQFGLVNSSALLMRGRLDSLNKGAMIAAAGVAALSVGLLGFVAGSAVIEGIQDAAVQRLESENKVRQTLHDQTQSLREQIAAAQTLAEMRLAETKAQKDAESARKKISVLEAKAAALDAGRHAGAVAGGVAMESGSALSTADQAELEAQREVLFYAERNLANLSNPAWVQGRLEANRRKAATLQEAESASKLVEKLAELRAEWDRVRLATLAPIDRIKALMPRRDKLQQELDKVPVTLTGDKAVDEGNEARRLDLLNRISAINDEIKKATEEASTQIERRMHAAEGIEKFKDESAALAAELAGNSDLVAQLQDQIRLREILREHEGMTLEMARERLNTEKALRAQANQRLAQDQAYSSALGRIAMERADIESNRYITEAEKNRQLLPLLERENTLIAQRLDLKLRELQATASPEAKLQLQQQIDDLRQKQSDNTRARGEAKPQTFGEGLEQGVSGRGGFLDSLGTAAQNAAEAVRGGLNSALQETSNFLYNLATGASSFREAWNQASIAVGQQFLRMITDMVAKMIWRATIEKGLIALSVLLHGSGEAAKTAATGAGVGMRLAMIVKEALASVYKGAIQAYESLSSIPYVGPFLGAAAMAAAIAGGIALVSKIGGHEQGGIVRGGKQLTWINENGEEAVIRNPSLRKFGEPFIERLNAGILDLSALPDNVARGVSMPAMGALANATPAAASRGASDGGGAGSMEEIAGRITVISVQSEREATRIARTSRARGDVVRIVHEEFGLPKKR